MVTLPLPLGATKLYAKAAGVEDRGEGDITTLPLSFDLAQVLEPAERPSREGNTNPHPYHKQLSPINTRKIKESFRPETHTQTKYSMSFGCHFNAGSGLPPGTKPCCQEYRQQQE